MWRVLPCVLVAVIEQTDEPFVPEAFYLAFERIDTCKIAFMIHILERADLVFLVCAVVIKHTDLHRYYRSVSLVLADHVYVFR